MLSKLKKLNPFGRKPFEPSHFDDNNEDLRQVKAILKYLDAEMQALDTLAARIEKDIHGRIFSRRCESRNKLCKKIAKMRLEFHYDTVDQLLRDDSLFDEKLLDFFDDELEHFRRYKKRNSWWFGLVYRAVDTIDAANQNLIRSEKLVRWLKKMDDIAAMSVEDHLENMIYVLEAFEEIYRRELFCGDDGCSVVYNDLEICKAVATGRFMFGRYDPATFDQEFQ